MVENSKHILILDDDPILREMFYRQVTFWGYTAFSCTSAIQALAYLRCRSVDVIITDYQMPNINGSKFLEHLRALALPWRIPVIMVRGDLSVSIKRFAKYRGAYTFLQKPVLFVELRRAIMNAIEDVTASIKDTNIL